MVVLQCSQKRKWYFGNWIQCVAYALKDVMTFFLTHTHKNCNMAHLFQNTAAADTDSNCTEAMLSKRVLG